MKYDYLREVKAENRPKMVACWDKKYFKKKNYMILLILYSLPGMVSALWNAFGLARWAWASFGAAASELLVLIGFNAFCSGMSSSNRGTYFRDLEPFDFWLDMMFIIGGYVFVIIGMWIGPE